MSGVVKEFVRRVFADSQFRQAFIRTPEDTLSGYRLEPEEHRALLLMSRRLVPAGGPGIGSPTGTWP